MNKRRRYRAVLLLGTVCLLIVGACGLWLRSQQQDSLNRQLIAALVTNDTKQALVLVNAGADPNTPYTPAPSFSFQQMCDYLFHRTALPTNRTPSAFLIACGAYWSTFRPDAAWHRPDDPHLVLVMLQHGANANTKDAAGYTPLLWAVSYNYRQTAGVLIDHGANVNAKANDGRTPLLAACEFCSRETVRLLLDHRADANVRDNHGTSVLFFAVFEHIFASGRTNGTLTDDNMLELLAHGADPNLADDSGRTALQFAEHHYRPDLVALLKQAGAKK